MATLHNILSTVTTKTNEATALSFNFFVGESAETQTEMLKFAKSHKDLLPLVWLPTKPNLQFSISGGKPYDKEYANLRLIFMFYTPKFGKKNGISTSTEDSLTAIDTYLMPYCYEFLKILNFDREVNLKPEGLTADFEIIPKYYWQNGNIEFSKYIDAILLKVKDIRINHTNIC